MPTTPVQTTAAPTAVSVSTGAGLTDILTAIQQLVQANNSLVVQNTALVKANNDLVTQNTALVTSTNNLVTQQTALVTATTQLVTQDTQLVTATNNLVTADTNFVTAINNEASNLSAAQDRTTAAIGTPTGAAGGTSAAAGNVGEFRTATSGSVGISNGVANGLVSMSLASGDWEVWGVIVFAGSGQVLSNVFAGVNSAASLPASNAYQTIGGNMLMGNVSLVMPRQRFNGTFTVYGVAQANFSTGSCTASGILNARRMR